MSKLPRPIDVALPMLFERLDALTAKVDALTAAVTRQRRPAVPASLFLGTIAAWSRGGAFTAAEVAQAALVDAAVGKVAGGLSAAQIAKRLQTTSVRAFTVVRHPKRERRGVLWSVIVADLHQDSGGSQPRGV